MSDLLDKAKNAMDNKLNQKAQPGDQVESTADNDVNNGINQVSNDAGFGQDNSIIDKVADAKVNSDIPFGNN